MMHQINTRGCRRSTTWRTLAGVAAASALVLGPVGVGAQPEPSAGDVPEAPVPELRPPPSPAEAMAAFSLVRSWVDVMHVPDEIEAAARVRAGACVTLRLAGRVVGMGSDLRSDGEALRAAAGEAIRQAVANSPIANDALREESLRALGAQLSLAIELAGELVPIRPRTYQDADLELSPWMDGVATRVGDQTRSVFPLYARRFNQLPGDSLAITLASASSEPSLGLRALEDSQPGKAGARLRATFYRFATTQLSQDAPGGSPIFLYRGGRLVDDRSLTVPGLQAWAGELSRHLCRWRDSWSQGRAAPGIYWPWLNKVDPTETGSREIGIVAYALAQVARSLRMPEEDRAKAGEAAGFLRERLAATLKTLEEDPAALAFAMLAALEAPAGDGTGVALRDACAEKLRPLFLRSSGWSDRVPPALRGLVACAMIESAVRAGDEEAIVDAEASLRSVYSQTAQGQLVSHLPWIGWAELTLAHHKGGAPAAVAPLRAAREYTWAVQVRPADADASTLDFVGGVVFPGGATPIPSAQSARVLAFFATMLGKPEFTDLSETPDEMMRVLAGMRFLRQLSVRADAAHDAPDRSMAVGGVCLSPWDQRQPPEATAMTLLAVLETIRGFELAGERMAGGVALPTPATRSDPATRNR